MTTTDYITEREFLDYIKSPAESGDPNIAAAISAVSALINQHCDRTFYLPDATSDRYFTPCTPEEWYVLPIEDIATLDDLVVAVDRTNSGTYAPLTLNTDFLAEPISQTRNGIAGWPYDTLRILSSTRWPIRLQPWWRDTVRVTGTFGWAEVPEPVKQAAKILTALYYKLGDAPLGVAGFDQFGSIRVREVPQVATLLTPFVSNTSFGIA